MSEKVPAFSILLRRVAAGAAFWAAGLCAGWLASDAYRTRPARPEGAQLQPLKNDLQKVIYQQTALGRVRFAAVYFQDLGSELWFGINDDEKFAPASLLKVPLLIAYLKWAEDDRVVMDKRLCFERQLDRAKPEVLSARHLELGRCYSVSDLLERMIVDSDNEAKDLLLFNLGMDRYRASYEDLGVEIPPDPGDTMSVKDYASFFRVLYNASYLSPAMSEKALGMLSRLEFKTGLRTGVNAGIPLAHKFGERTLGAVRELHDCGVVYYPGHPYLLCVMSRGRNYAEMDEVIGRVSRTVYTEMERRFPRAALPPSQPPYAAPRPIPARLRALP